MYILIHQKAAKQQSSSMKMDKQNRQIISKKDPLLSTPLIHSDLQHKYSF